MADRAGAEADARSFPRHSAPPPCGKLHLAELPAGIGLDKAIAACWMLMDELQYVAEALPADFNKFTKLALKIEELVNKIKALRKSDAKRFKQMEGK